MIGMNLRSHPSQMNDQEKIALRPVYNHMECRIDENVHRLLSMKISDKLYYHGQLTEPKETVELALQDSICRS